MKTVARSNGKVYHIKKILGLRLLLNVVKVVQVTTIPLYVVPLPSSAIFSFFIL
jgi:hypothetical protein